MKLTEMQKVPHFRGFAYRELFDNGYGISVIPEEDGASYEVAVLEHTDGKRARLTYETPITNDVIRFCYANMVDSFSEEIRSLPANLY